MSMSSGVKKEKDVDKIQEAMAEISGLNEKGGKGTTKVQGGKIYTNVSTRVEVFRKHFGFEYGIETAPLFPHGGGIFMQAWIKKGGEIVGSGHAFSQNITKEKGIEKLETTAIGRALASLGLSGGEYASDVEMETWQERYEEPKKQNGWMSDDEVPPETWLKAKIARMEEFVTKPKSTVEKLIDGDTATRKDPIFSKLNDGQRLEYEEAVKAADFALKARYVNA